MRLQEFRKRLTLWTSGLTQVPATQPLQRLTRNWDGLLICTLKAATSTEDGSSPPLLTATAVKGRAPYKEVLTHGYVVDGQGRKMSKSLGNGIDPMDVCNQYGADILRLWVASSDYKVDIRISNDILKQLSESYRKIRNTARFILGNIYDFDPDKDSLAYNELEEIDKWALLRLNQLVERIEKSYSEYEFHTMLHAIHNFCVVDMSSFYLDVTKDRMYASRPDDKARRAGQTTMYIILTPLQGFWLLFLPSPPKRYGSTCPIRTGTILKA